METQKDNYHRREKTPFHSAEMEAIGIFVGEWELEGTYGLDRKKIRGKETYTFLEEEYFLINKFDRAMEDGKKHTGLGFIGFDTVQGRILSYSCDNLGYTRTYEVDIEPSAFALIGEHEKGRIELAHDGQILSIQWFILQNGKWQELCSLSGTKIQ